MHPGKNYIDVQGRRPDPPASGAPFGTFRGGDQYRFAVNVKPGETRIVPVRIDPAHLPKFVPIVPPEQGRPVQAFPREPPSGSNSL